MTVLVTADLHFSSNQRDLYRHTFQKRLRQIVQDENVDAVIILGDLTEDKDEHGAWLVNQIVDHMYRLAMLCPVVIVRGNHDAVDPDHPYYEFLRRIAGRHSISWVNAPTSAKNLSVRGLEGLGPSLFLPYSADYARDWKHEDFTKYDWVFTHNTFAGSYIGNQQILPGIPPKVFPKNVEVISGDIHIPQTVPPRGGHITYVGAPYLVDFGDDYRPRVLLLEGDQSKSLRVGGAQKRLVEVAVRELKKGVSYCSPGDILKVRVKLKADEYAKWPEFQEKVRAWGIANKYHIYSVIPVKQEAQSSAASSKRKSRARKPDAQLVREYADSMGIDKPTLRAGLRLVEKA